MEIKIKQSPENKIKAKTRTSDILIRFSYFTTKPHWLKIIKKTNVT